MTSLSYGTWISSPETDKKKRSPTYDKPPKQTQVKGTKDFNNQSLLDVNDLDLNLNTTTTSLNEYTQSTEKNQSEIHDLLDQMNRENFENEQSPLLIQPIPPPQLIQKSGEGGVAAILPISSMPEGDELSNYQTIYAKGTTYNPPGNPFANKGTPHAVGGMDNQILLEKLNYMIYLLEQQQNEKTDHIWEEFLLYCFLGVFMIYIVDGFARSGAASASARYIR